jgi:DNA polymerase-3 subunit delta
MELRVDRFERQLAGESLRPAYLVAGTEPLLVQECADAVRARATAEGFAEREVFDAGSGFDWNALSMAIASPSLFSPRRLLEVRLPTGRPDKEGSEVLSGFCADPPPDTVVLVTAQDWSTRHGGKWSEAIASAGHVVIAWPIRPGDLVDWLSRRLRSRGLSAEPAAVALLAERVEGNLLAAAQEIDKLALLAPGAQLTLDAMQDLVADSARFDVFKLAEAALAGDAARARRMLHALRGEGEQVAGLLPIVANELTRLATLARTGERGGNLAQAMREARVWDSKQALYRRALERHPAARWEAFVAEAGQVELLSKGRGTGDAWLRMERLLGAVADARARALLA